MKGKVCEAEHPELVTVYVMMTLPAIIGVTTPVLLIAAISTSEDVHIPVGVLSVRIAVLLLGRQTDEGPEMGATVGFGVTFRISHRNGSWRWIVRSDSRNACSAVHGKRKGIDTAEFHGCCAGESRTGNGDGMIANCAYCCGRK